MTEYEPCISCVGSDRFTNCLTTIALRLFLQYKKNISPYIRATHVFKLSDWLAIFLTHSGG